MNNLDTTEDEEGKEYLIFDKSEIYDDSQMGDKYEDFIIIKKLGRGSYGNVFKVKSKKNNKIYAMKAFDVKYLEHYNQIKSTKREDLLKYLSHPHIVKYHKQIIKEEKNIYHIYEFIPNGDLGGFYKSHKIWKKQIPEEEIWNLLLQSMEALCYIHSKKLIHRDIKPENLFIDNNMSVKLGDFGVCALMSDSPFKNIDEEVKFHQTSIQIGTDGYIPPEVHSKNYDQRYDVYSMGISFFEICYFHGPDDKKKQEDKNVHYSKELLDIINLMMEKIKDNRKTSKEFLDMIKKEYSKKYVKNTSINSIIRCLYAFSPLTMYFLINKFENKPITEAYIQCLKYIAENPLKQEISPINEIRQILGSLDSKLEGSKEVDPIYIFQVLIKELHKELNKPPEITPYKNEFLINAELNKEEMMIKFINKTSNKLNSFISKSFRGLIKTSINCEGNKCDFRTFKYTNFFYITFNLEKLIEKKNDINEINIKLGLYSQTDHNEINSLYCKKCLKKTNHYSYNYFYSLPNLLIIYIQRKLSDKYTKQKEKIPIKISEILDIEDKDDNEKKNKQFSKGFFKNCKTKYILVGFLGKIDSNGNEKFFSVSKYQYSWILYEGNKINEIKSLSDYKPIGDIIMLFYQAVN